jgi:hypothetical protein
MGVTQGIGAERAPAPLASTKRAQALIEVTAEAWSSDPLALPGDTRQALASDGRAELLNVLDDELPPRVIRCGSSGCSRLVRGRAQPNVS